MVTSNNDFTLEDLKTFVDEINKDNTERLLRERRRTPARLGEGALRKDFKDALNTGLDRDEDLEDLNQANR